VPKDSTRIRVVTFDTAKHFIIPNFLIETVCLPASVALSVASRYALPGCGHRRLGSRPRLARSLCQVITAYDLRLNSRAGTEGSTVSSLTCDRWLILGLETLSISRCLNH